MSLSPKKVLSVAVLLLPLLLHGKGGGAHVNDMSAVFGPSESGKCVEFFRKVTDYIDNQNDCFWLHQKLKRVAPYYSWGNYSHRIYFHWGFNQQPKDSSALKECIERATEDEQKREEMFLIVKTENRSRVKQLLFYVQLSFLGSADQSTTKDRSTTLTRTEMNAIITLAYDTHILGDYVEGTDDTRKPLMPMEKLVKDITAVFDRLKRDDDVFRNHPERPLLQRKFNSRMRQAAKASSASKAADEMLKVMKEIVPRLLRMTDRIQRMLQLKELEPERE